MNKSFQKWLNIKDEEIKQNLLSLDQKQIDENFSNSLEFGTAGLRGVMGLGTNNINSVTICKLAYSVVSLAKKNKYKNVVIGFDTRHNSKQYANIIAKVLAKSGLNVFIFKSFVPTPVLTFSIKKTKSDLGLMITASHNNKNYNGVKISTFNSIQISGETEKTLQSLYKKQNEVLCFNEFLTYQKQKFKNIKLLGNQLKKQFIGDVYKNNINNCLNIIYTPLNGTAYNYVKTVLKSAGFKKIKTPFSQKYPNGNFTTCSYPNPEFIEAYRESLKCTETFDADVIVATDPDGDRLGALIKSTKGYKLLTGNEMGFLLLNYAYENRIKNNNLYAVGTVVSSPMFFKICEKYGINYEKTLTGFKNIGKGKIKLEQKLAKDGFLLAYEESCGYIVRDDFYDKDGIFALLKFCELASYLKSTGSSVEEYLNELYEKFENIYSLNSSISFNGQDAFLQMNEKVNSLRQKGIKTLMRKKVIQTIDYLNDKTGLEKSNFIEYKTQDFSFIIRPSGTEPKLKIYIHTKAKTLEQSKKLSQDVLLAIKKEIFNINE